MRRLQNFVWSLGSGLITGAADDDPSGIATYSQAGAAFGFDLLWTALITFPLMTVVQLMCSRIGLVTRSGLAGVLRQHYPRWLLGVAVALLLVANIINIAADLDAMAAGIRLATGVGGRWVIVGVAVLMLLMVAYGSYDRITLVFKWLALALLSYVGAAVLAHPDWLRVLTSTVVPRVRPTPDYLLTVVAILGTTISPYLFFWQAAHTAEGEMSLAGMAGQPSHRTLTVRLGPTTTDTVSGMALSNIIMYFIIVTAGATLHAAGKTSIQTAEQAAVALRPLAGPAAELLFALGLIGTGALAVPILAGSAAFAIAEAGDWPRGLGKTPGTAGRFYSVLAVMLGVGVALTFVGIDVIRLLFWCAVINGLLAPPLVITVLAVCNNAAVMGAHTNGRLFNVLGSITAVLMTGAAIGLIASWVT